MVQQTCWDWEFIVTYPSTERQRQGDLFELQASQATEGDVSKPAGGLWSEGRAAGSAGCMPSAAQPGVESEWVSGCLTGTLRWEDRVYRSPPFSSLLRRTERLLVLVPLTPVLHPQPGWDGAHSCPIPVPCWLLRQGRV